MAKKNTTVNDGSEYREIEAYTHDDKKRKNNPKVGMAHKDTAAETLKTYAFDPHLTPTLDWAGKAEHTSFEVPTSSIHIHESIKPHKIIRSIQSIGENDDVDEKQLTLFEEIETPLERMQRRRQEIEFYEHEDKWANRLIAGDSLVVMNSLLQKEGMAGQVQMVYFDPPYGIKYGSNFQPFVDKRDVKDKKDEDLTQEPEMIKAFRDTWELGIHSYLTYLRDRLLLARELLADTGSVFVQISDENLHHVREICDEVFGAENFIALIPFRKKTMPLGASFLERMHDYIVWYGKDSNKTTYHQLYERQNVQGDYHWGWVEFPNGERRKMTKEEVNNHSLLPPNSKIFSLVSLNPVSFSANAVFDIEFEGKIHKPSAGQCWVTNPEGIKRLIDNKRIMQEGSESGKLRYIYYLDDYPLRKITCMWDNTVGARNPKYVVQTSEKVVQRCMIMTSDPGDLVLDLTCGSGTTAYVAEQWGRRWITCDTSRVAISIAKQRLMTATFDYYKLLYPEIGISGGMQYTQVKRIALKNIANNEPAALVTQYDQPEIDKNKIRITGPFTVEALPAPAVKPLDDTAVQDEDLTAKENDWCEQLRATGIMGRGGSRLMFSRVELLSGTRYLQAEAETKEDTPRRAVICFSGETKPLDSRMVNNALDEAEKQRPTPQIIIFAAFQFDPTAANLIDETNWGGVTLLKAQMNTDLMTDDLKKKRSSDQSFWLIGQPDVELKKWSGQNKYKVIVNGFDYYDVKKGTVESGSVNRIAMWMLDKDYDGMCVEPHQVFFPMGGKKDGWSKLAKTLRAEINQDLVGKYAGNESLWFKAEPGTSIAVKIIDDRGIESLKIIRIGDE